MTAEVVKKYEAFPGARVKFFGNVLHCEQHRTFAENLVTCMNALAMITGLSVEELSQSEQITVEAYRSS